MQLKITPNHETFGIMSCIWDHLQVTNMYTDLESQTVPSQEMNINGNEMIMDLDVDGIGDKYQNGIQIKQTERTDQEAISCKFVKKKYCRKPRRILLLSGF